jgi:hypothetical protein
MSDKRGVRSYYLIMTELEKQLLADPDVNTVTFGDITKVDLSKQTIFPLSHIVMNNVIQSGQTMTYNFEIYLIDIVDISKADPVNQFTGATNEMDILNTQLAVGNRLVERMRSGNLYEDMYQVTTDVSFNPFYDRFENELAGWSLNVSIIVKNDIYIC